MHLGTPPPLRAKKLPESNPLKSRLLVPELTVSSAVRRDVNACRWGVAGTRRHLRSVLIISVREISNRGSRIQEPWLMFTSKCPLKVQISQGLEDYLKHKRLKSDRATVSSNIFSSRNLSQDHLKQTRYYYYYYYYYYY